MFVPDGVDASKPVAFREDDVRLLSVGSEESFAYLEVQKKRTRVTVVARPGDTLAAIARRYGTPTASVERANRRARSDVLEGGEAVVLYLAKRGASGASGARKGPVLDDPFAPVPNGALPDAPAPDALPRPL